MRERQRERHRERQKERKKKEREREREKIETENGRDSASGFAGEIHENSILALSNHVSSSQLIQFLHHWLNDSLLESYEYSKGLF